MTTLVIQIVTSTSIRTFIEMSFSLNQEALLFYVRVNTLRLIQALLRHNVTLFEGISS